MSLSVNGVLVNDTASGCACDGASIKQVQVFTTFNELITVKEMKLDSTFDPTPNFINFQNGIRQITNDITLSWPHSPE